MSQWMPCVTTAGRLCFRPYDPASTVVATGGSSLTPQESAQLMALDTSGLAAINRGVQRASLLIPHTEEMP
jgi:hypothetical protein